MCSSSGCLFSAVMTGIAAAGGVTDEGYFLLLTERLQRAHAIPSRKENRVMLDTDETIN